MIRHDLTHWPLVLSVLRGPSTLEEQFAFFRQWTDWLQRGQTFATLRVFQDAAALERPSGGGKEAKLWLQQNGEAIRRLVAGMATVVPPERFEEVSRMNAEKLFGVPAQTFAQIAPATRWIGSLLDAQGLDIDLEKAGATLQRLMLD